MRCGRLMAVSSALLFLVGPLVPHPSAGLNVASAGQVLISEFYACAPSRDEYFVLANTASAPVELGNWSVTDGEGTIEFLPGVVLGAGVSMAVSTNWTSFTAAYQRMPEVPLDLGISSSFVILSGTFRLADAGDSIVLRTCEGVAVDSVCYGPQPRACELWTGPPLPLPRPGEVFRRVGLLGILLDRDAADDWQYFREFRYGHTDLDCQESAVPAGKVRAFVSPDCSQDVVLEAVRSARRDIRLCAYELSSSPVCEALLGSSARGVDVRVLVEGNPAGGMDARSVACLSVLSSRGIDVRVIVGNLSEKVVRHIGYLHSKFMVVDSEIALVMSENFVESGLPSDRLFGNRGWGLQVTDRSISGFLSAMFDDDGRASRPNVRVWTADPRYDPFADVPEGPSSANQRGIVGPFTTTSPSAVRVLVSPDSSPLRPFIVDLIDGSSSVVAEQFQADLEWADRWAPSKELSPIVSALKSRAESGSDVRVLLDSSWFNAERNGEVVSYLASKGSDPAERFALVDGRSPITVLHNKGAVFNHRTVMVSSNNWCRASFAENRELAIAVESEELAAFFERVFALDWEPDLVPPIADAGPDIEVPVTGPALLDGSGSSDDRAIANWSWDLGADGVADGYGEVWRFSAAEPGKLRVILTVEDCWGNRASDDMEFNVAEAPRGSADVRLAMNPAVASMFATAFAVGAAWARSVAIRRMRGRPRKVNHSRPGSP